MAERQVVEGTILHRRCFQYTCQLEVEVISDSDCAREEHEEDDSRTFPAGMLSLIPGRSGLRGGGADIFQS